jgi:hypothetical protein
VNGASFGMPVGRRLRGDLRSRVISRKAIAAAAAACVAVVFACGEPRSDASGQPGSAERTLQWAMSGDTLVVGDRWLYEVSDRSFTRLDPPDATDEATWRASLSASGDRILWFDGDDRIIVEERFGARSRVQTEIPVWIGAEPSLASEPFNVPFWAQGGRVIVQQLDVTDPTRQACGDLKPATGKWTRIKREGCLTGGFYFVAKIEPIRGDVFAVYSSAEGANAVDVQRCSEVAAICPEAPLGELITLSHAPAQVAVIGGELRVLFPCTLMEETGDCPLDANLDRDAWTLYAWQPPDRSLVPLRTGLPAGARLSPTGDRIAWRRDADICLRELGSSREACTALPER